jgi:hypothetical protein
MADDVVVHFGADASDLLETLGTLKDQMGEAGGAADQQAGSFNKVDQTLLQTAGASNAARSSFQQMAAGTQQADAALNAGQATLAKESSGLTSVAKDAQTASTAMTGMAKVPTGGDQAEGLQKVDQALQQTSGAANTTRVSLQQMADGTQRLDVALGAGQPVLVKMSAGLVEVTQGSKAAASAMGGLAAATGAANRAAAESIDTMEKLRLQEIKVDEEILRQRAKAGELSSSEEVARLTYLMQEEEGIRLAGLNRMNATGTMSADEYGQRYNIIVKKYSADAAKTQSITASEVTKEWEQALGPIDRAFGSTITSMITRQEPLKTAVASAAKSMLSSYMGSMEQMVTKWASSQLAMATTAKAGAQADLTDTVQSEAQKTAATKSGVAAREAAGNSENSSFLGQIGTQLARWTGLESAKTGATVAGTGTRTTIENAASTETATVNAATATKSIGSKAADAAAGAYDAMAGIPIVGPVLGAAAAVATFAAVMAYSSIASAEGGWDQVPQDGMLAELHKDEMVLPAALADPLRNALQSKAGGYAPPPEMFRQQAPQAPAGQGGAGGGAGGNHSTVLNYSPSVNAIDTQGARDFLDRHGRYMVDVLARQHRNFAQAKK